MSALLRNLKSKKYYFTNKAVIIPFLKNYLLVINIVLKGFTPVGKVYFSFPS